MALVLALAPLAGLAYEYGPDPRYTGAPGDNKTACISAGCHVGVVNTGGGGVTILVPNGTTYTPGQPMTVSVQITDATKVKYGFELTARLASNTSNGQAGDFTPGADGYTQVICDDGSTKKNGSPCSAQFPVEFIEHTLAGYESSTKGGYTFTFTWTPPPASAGNVILYAAGNAGPGDPPVQTPTNVYTTNLTLTPGAASPAPTINTGGVVPISSPSTTISPGTWISIFGNNFTNAAAIWQGDFPTELGGATVTIDGKLAYLWYVGRGQINAQVPDDPGRTGTVNVTVTNAAGSGTATATLAAESPSWILLDSKHVAGIAIHPDGSYDIIGPTGSSLGYPTKAAQAGDVVELFGVGFGPTNPPVPSGQAYSGNGAPTATPVTVTVNGVAIPPAFAGITAAGTFQINLPIPPGLGTGDVPLSAIVAGASTQNGVVISLQ